ncbi:MAG: hypothetical protein WCP80_10235 [Phycisphaerales bacterium]
MILGLAVLLWSTIAVFVNLVVVPILFGRDGKTLHVEHAIHFHTHRRIKPLDQTVKSSDP